MQKCLVDNKCNWYKFYGNVIIEGDNASTVVLPKDLFDDEFLFDTDFTHVAVNAIVGANGSGKSSIVEMMIRILNNTAAAVMGEKPLFAAAEHLHYIEEVHGAILYLQGSDLFQLKVDGFHVSIASYTNERGDNKYTIRDEEFLLKETQRALDIPSLKSKPLSINKDKYASLSNLFYTIVCNYSLYSFNYSDLWAEMTNEDVLKAVEDEPGSYSRYPFLKIWLSGLFHKNDGYQCPVVINPMRHGGMVDASRENTLAKERIVQLLFHKVDNNIKKDKQFELYPFRVINDELYVTGLSVLKNDASGYMWSKEWMDSPYFKGRSELYDNYNTYNKYIWEFALKQLRITTDEGKNRDLRRYLVYKVVKIALHYSRYRHIIDILKEAIIDKKALERELEFMFSDTTHVTAKLRRTLTQIKYSIYGKPEPFSLTWLDDTLPEYVRLFNKEVRLFKATIEDFLPCPVFSPELRIVKKERYNDGNFSDSDIIGFWTLSSGERQIAYSVSNFLYHLINIDSVWKSTNDINDQYPLLKYNYVYAIFDEIELYYHPDLQRRYLTYLMKSLSCSHLEYIKGICITIVTHSPFVLSDLPSSNVLALSKSGETDLAETFGANIHELLSRSFFMDYTIGQIAQEQIEEIFRLYNRYLNNKDTHEISEIIDQIRVNRKKYDYIADHISDEYLKEYVRKALEEMYSLDLDTEILRTERHLEDLKNRKEQLKGYDQV